VLDAIKKLIDAEVDVAVRVRADGHNTIVQANPSITHNHLKVLNYFLLVSPCYHDVHHFND
jgi:hypothetical protein